MSTIMRNRISCIIPNWNGKDRLGKAITSLLNQTYSDTITIIVVDNGSVDGSVAFVKQHYPQVELIEHHKNYGYAGGVNAGLRSVLQHDNHFVATFNNDAIADTYWLEKLVLALEQNPEVGIATSKL